MEEKIINLLRYRGDGSTLFTGRPQGEEVREELKLDILDKSSQKVRFVIPKGTTSFNPSFYLGLLFESIERLGKEKFDEKYLIDYSDVDVVDDHDVIEDDLKDAMRHALNSLSDDTGFGDFL